MLRVARIESSRGKLDVFSDRLLKASSESTLLSAVEHLLRAVDADLGALHPPIVTETVNVASSSDALCVLRWLREHAKLAVMLAASLCRFHVHGDPPGRDEEPFEVPLPLAKWRLGETWGWRASALFSDGVTCESVQKFRKRFREERVELTTGSPNLTNGPYRNWEVSIPLLLVPRMVAYAVGCVRTVKHELCRYVRYLGRKRAYGRGSVVGIEVERISEDRSLFVNGATARWFPWEGGIRLVRPRPPYWNSVGRVRCVEIGEVIEADQIHLDYR